MLHWDGFRHRCRWLPEDSKAQIFSLQFVDAELARLYATEAVFQIARTGYLSALKPHLAALDASRAKPAHYGWAFTARALIVKFAGTLEFPARVDSCHGT